MTIKPEHDEHLKASIDAAAKKMPAYSLKPQLVQELVDAVVAANNAQPASPSQAQLILAFHLILKDWAVHPMHPNYPQDEKTPKVDALFRELHDAVIEQYETSDNRTFRIAKELCVLANRNLMLPDGPDNPNINQVIMGEENLTVPVAGGRKRLACLVYPLKPLWAHYIRDAMDAEYALGKIEEEEKKKNAV